MAHKALDPGLYFVATPIGTASDITLRALDVLRGADVLAAEDTRRARQLMDIHGIPVAGRPMVAYHDHNGAKARPRLLQALAEGQRVAYVSDAGTPLIADPGYKLLTEAVEAEVAVHAIPGPSAVMSALSVAGLPTDRFLFEGFLPPKSQAARKTLEGLRGLEATLVFFESPKRLLKTLSLMADVLGGARRAAVCRELTKKFETVYRDSLYGLVSQFSDGPDPKGEIVVVVEGKVAGDVTVEDIDDALAKVLQNHSVRDSVTLVCDMLDAPRKLVYERAIAASSS